MPIASQAIPESVDRPDVEVNISQNLRAMGRCPEAEAAVTEM
jgi:hypothetical protein